MNLWLNRNFNIFFTINSLSTKVLSLNKSSKEISLIANTGTKKITIPNLFNGKKLFYGWQKIVVQTLQYQIIPQP